MYASLEKMIFLYIPIKFCQREYTIFPGEKYADNHSDYTVKDAAGFLLFS